MQGNCGTFRAATPGAGCGGYAQGKLRSDPVYAAAAKEIATYPAPVLDIGCEIDLFAHYLHAFGCRGPYLGVDMDEREIRSAQHALRTTGEIRFQQGSCEALAPWHGHVVTLDVLHDLERMFSTICCARQRPA